MKSFYRIWKPIVWEVVGEERGQLLWRNDFCDERICIAMTVFFCDETILRRIFLYWQIFVTEQPPWRNILWRFWLWCWNNNFSKNFWNEHFFVPIQSPWRNILWRNNFCDNGTCEHVFVTKTFGTKPQFLWGVNSYVKLIDTGYCWSDWRGKNVSAFHVRVYSGPTQLEILGMYQLNFLLNKW